MARLVITVDSPDSTSKDLRDSVEGLQSGDLDWDDVVDLEKDDVTFEFPDAA